MTNEGELAAYYGLSPEQFLHAKRAAEMEWWPAASNLLMSLILRYPDQPWRRVIAASIEMRRNAE